MIGNHWSKLLKGYLAIISNAEARYPDISDTTSRNQWPQGFSGLEYQAVSSQQPFTSLDQSTAFNMGTHQQSRAPFQPTSVYGQHLAAHNIQTSSDYMTRHIPNQNTCLLPQQQLQNSAGYLAQFDPYAHLGQGWDGTIKGYPQATSSNSTASGNISGKFLPSIGNLHPRECLRKHKSGIESWDEFAWKQLLNSFDAFKDVWERHTKDIEGRINQLQMHVQLNGPGFPAQFIQEKARLQSLLKTAQCHFDSITASSFQIREVFEGYRQSGDSASKSRVREASNAAVAGLPDWPPPV